MEKLQSGKAYPRGDSLTLAEAKSLGLTSTMGQQAHSIKAVWTEETRKPKTGEWYLSGAIIAAYRAYDDLNRIYPIARLVNTKTETLTIIEEE